MTRWFSTDTVADVKTCMAWWGMGCDTWFVNIYRRRCENMFRYFRDDGISRPRLKRFSILFSVPHLAYAVGIPIEYISENHGSLQADSKMEYIYEIHCTLQADSIIEYKK